MLRISFEMALANASDAPCHHVFCMLVARLLAWLDASRIVFRAQGESPAPWSGQKRAQRGQGESCNEVCSDNYPTCVDALRQVCNEATRRLQKSTRPF